MRFNIRDLFWIAVVTACGVSWWLTYCRATRLQAENAQLQVENLRLKGEVQSSLADWRTLYNSLNLGGDAKGDKSEDAKGGKSD